ncbi:helix-turn-helix domain-containing protein [Frondihabitans australicus]|uniref:helix-turn-helix domain-containing protein n=1 Tax=Frondihabitans australicus TaxID=386892 RepID=UPI0014739A5B|nr:helix-turn-helix transcriptional regulator [Frondihabitans australicus]
MSKKSKRTGWPPSDRQTQILVLLAQGLPYKEIGRRLVLAPATVSYHVTRMQQGSNARSLGMLIAKAFVLGFLTAELLPMLGADDLPLDGN